MSRLLRHTLLLLTPLLLLPGCKSIDMLYQKDSEKSLQATLHAYQATMRWGYPGQAYNFLHQDLAASAQVPGGLENIQVTGYKVIKRPDLVAEDQASQVVIIGYVFNDRQVEKSLTDRQLWQYDKEKDAWARINPIPEFK
jgi:hypothetical protein